MQTLSIMKSLDLDRLTTHLLKSPAGLQTVDVLPDTCVVDLSIAAGQPCSWKTDGLAYCCNTDALWPHRRIAIHGSRKGQRVRFENVKELIQGTAEALSSSLSGLHHRAHQCCDNSSIISNYDMNLQLLNASNACRLVLSQ